MVVKVSVPEVFAVSVNRLRTSYVQDVAFTLLPSVTVSVARFPAPSYWYAVVLFNASVADTVRGAQSSAVAYSIVETAKANGLNPYQYLLYLLSGLPAVLSKDPEADLSRFLPWAADLPDRCRRDSAPSLTPVVVTPLH